MKQIKIIIIVLIVVALLTGLIIILDKLINNNQTYMKTEKKVRPAAVAGAFYPESVEELNQTINALLSEKKPIEGKIRALVVPHAGYSYSGAVAGQAFANLEDKDYKTVWVLGPSHYTSFSGVSVPDYTHYQTPLGEVPVSSIALKLLEEKNFLSKKSAHAEEHALEVELPFLQSILDNFEIVPMIFGNQTSLDQIKEVVEVLKKYYTPDTLIVVSCDFIHYGPNYGYVPFAQHQNGAGFAQDAQANIKVMDDQVIDYLLNYQTEELYKYLKSTAVTNDGGQVLTWLSEFFKDTVVKGQLMAYDTSGYITGDTTNSVSYVSLAFTGNMPQDLTDEPLSESEKEYLLKLARDTLNYYFETGKMLGVSETEIPERLKVIQGAFVTLEKNHQLRGCIGYIEPVKELYQSVIDNAISAAVNDHRFMPVSKDELIDIAIEISVLSVPKIINVAAADRLASLRPVTDGVVLREGSRSSTYLPQVWEDLQDPENFLQSLCQKGGWSSNCWKNEKVELSTYQAEVFKEQ